MPTKVKLSEIRSLTLYAGEKTKARRSSPVPQLKCIGKPCKNYQPDVIRCTNTGGSGVEVDWECNADLPSSLRLGRVEVSCEGWSRPGDPDVLKGSCGLEYHLQEVPKTYREHGQRPTSDRTLTDYTNEVIDNLFFALYIIVALFLGYLVFSACFSGPRSHGGRGGNSRTDGPGGPRGRGDGGPGGGPGGGGGRGGRPGHGPPPPPYSKDDPNTSPTSSIFGSPPPFLTGFGLGTLFGRYAVPSRGDDPYRAQQERYMRPSMWDWERPGGAGMFNEARDPPPMRARPAPPQGSERAGGNGGFGGSSDDRGEGSSTGVSRQSTGYGGSRVR